WFPNMGLQFVADITESVSPPAGSAKIDAALVERIDRHRVAQNIDVAVALRQTLGKRLPLVPTRPAAVYAQLAVRGIVFPVALDRDDVDRLGLMGMDVDYKSEVGRQVSADLPPRVAGIVRAHDIPVLLHEQDTRARPVHCDSVNAVAYVGVRVGDVLGPQSTIDRPPNLPGIVGAEHACGRDGDEHTVVIARIEKDGVEAHTASARRPAGS